jgi:hypothetical protein
MAIGQHILRTLSYLSVKRKRREPGDIILRAVYLSLQMLDLGLTLVATNLGFLELNPLMRDSLTSPCQLVIFKFCIPLLITWFVPGKLLIPAIVLLGGIIGWNVKELLML